MDATPTPLDARVESGWIQQRLYPGAPRGRSMDARATYGVGASVSCTSRLGQGGRIALEKRRENGRAKNLLPSSSRAPTEKRLVLDS